MAAFAFYPALASQHPERSESRNNRVDPGIRFGLGAAGFPTAHNERSGGVELPTSASLRCRATVEAGKGSNSWRETAQAAQIAGPSAAGLPRLTGKDGRFVLFLLRAWFNREPFLVTPLGLLSAITLTRSASEGRGYPRWRFGLVWPECHPILNQAQLRAYYARRPGFDRPPK